MHDFLYLRLIVLAVTTAALNTHSNTFYCIKNANQILNVSRYWLVLWDWNTQIIPKSRTRSSIWDCIMLDMSPARGSQQIILPGYQWQHELERCFLATSIHFDCEVRVFGDSWVWKVSCIWKTVCEINSICTKWTRWYDIAWERYCQCIVCVRRLKVRYLVG